MSNRQIDMSLVFIEAVQREDLKKKKCRVQVVFKTTRREFPSGTAGWGFSDVISVAQVRSGHCPGTSLIPGPGTYTCHSCGPKNKNK